MEIRLKLRNLLFRLLNKVENNNNVDFYKNGEHTLLRLIMQKHNGNKLTLFDVGANVGGFTAVALKTFREVDNAKKIAIHAFEPLLPTFKQLQANLNTEQDCTLVNSGISAEYKTAEIYYDETRDTCASLYNRKEVHAPTKVTIALTRLDTYLQENNIQEIDLLKIDTEGHELSVLESAGKYLNPAIIKNIQFEYGGTYLDSRIYLRDIYNLLTAKNYTICKLYGNKIKERDYHPVMENFQYANYVAMGKAN